MSDLIQLIRQLYQIHPAGGPLHAELDDGNLDGTITPSYEHLESDPDAHYYEGWAIADLPPEAPAVVEGLGRSTRQICDEIAAIMNTMTVEEREAARAEFWREWRT